MIKLRKLIFIALLLAPLSILHAQSDSSDEENPITDPVLLEKLKQIDTMEKLLEITKSDSLTTGVINDCLLYTSPSPRDATLSRMPSSA